MNKYDNTHTYKLQDHPATRGAASTKLSKPKQSGCTRSKDWRDSLQRDRPGGLTSPAFHACGSASPFRACCCHSNSKTVVSSTQVHIPPVSAVSPPLSLTCGQPSCFQCQFNATLNVNSLSATVARIRAYEGFRVIITVPPGA